MAKAAKLVSSRNHCKCRQVSHSLDKRRVAAICNLTHFSLGRDIDAATISYCIAKEQKLLSRAEIRFSHVHQRAQARQNRNPMLDQNLPEMSLDNAVIHNENNPDAQLLAGSVIDCISLVKIWSEEPSPKGKAQNWKNLEPNWKHRMNANVKVSHFEFHHFEQPCCNKVIQQLHVEY